jgi:type I restriction-modification system DNA methylase subunit
MALSLNKPKLDNLASDIWKSAERLRGKFKSYEYQSVILPIIVIRRLECVLIDWREKKARKLELTRYKAGMPRVNDGALLFLDTRLAKMAQPEEGGSRIAIILMARPCLMATAASARPADHGDRCAESSERSEQS